MISKKMMEIARSNGYSVLQAKGFFASMNEVELKLAESGELAKAIGEMATRTKAAVDKPEKESKGKAKETE